VNSKIFVIISVTFLVISFLFHFVIWEKVTKYIHAPEYSNMFIGNLGRLSLQKDIFSLRPKASIKNKNHFTLKEWDGKPVDVITLGDSFSRGNGNGEDNFYQDWISEIHGLRVLNLIDNVSGRYIESVMLLKNSGFLAKAKPKYIIIQELEQSISLRDKQNFKTTMELSNVEKRFQLDKSKDDVPTLPMINFINIKVVLYGFLYKFNYRGFIGKVFSYKLDRDFFSSKTKNMLYVYKGDVLKVKKYKKEDLEFANSNLNRLALILKKDNIKLIFMPVANKLNLYSKYLKEQPVKNEYFEIFRLFKKEYTFVDTKKILRQELNKGVVDLY
jgi:hypothetical protein